MHSVVLAHYARLFELYPPADRVLEVGATPQTANGYTEMLPGREYIGVNLNPPTSGNRWKILTGNGHELPFRDGEFDAVISNAMLEHDDRFWLTLAETRRVLRPGGLFFVGAPGFSAHRRWTATAAILIGDRLFPRLGSLRTWGRIISTTTYPYHAAPDDYWRFSPSAVRDVFLEGFDVLAVDEVFTPPRVVGVGRLRDQGLTLGP
jgi:SAM-dependent methyltransferase